MTPPAARDPDPQPFSTVGAVTRLIVPAWILVLAAFQLAIGTTEALPLWLYGLSLRFGVEPLTTLRVLVWTEFAIAGLIVVFGHWSRGLAILALVAIAFSSMASISAAIDAPRGILMATAALAVSLVLLAIVLRAAPRRSDSALSIQWRVIAALALVAASGILAAQLPLRAAPPSFRERMRPPSDVVEMDFRGFIGEPMAATPVAGRFGMITARTLEGRVIVVFYNPDCGACHDLFRERFSGRLEIPVLAVRVPPPRDANRLASDQPEQVDCPECEFIDLPEGPLYLLTPPMVVVTDEGRIACVADQRTLDECLGPAPN
ncbi:MAG TPA: hypothetical protein PKC43_09815 [Phycisphaerales bacterium]|nr:hypothetical protein [Phycisphaerales bacterium]HMP37730.1 hypothetical protein [Phycisphaerales bacterium]